MRVSIVIPTYNESETIASLIKTNLSILPSANIVIVDDSKDLSVVNVIEGMADSRVRVFHRDAKGGRGSAVILGIKKALENEVDYIVEMDADFSHNPEEIKGLLEKAQSNQYDLLIASRYKSSSKILNWPIKRRIFSRAANILARALLGISISDYTNGFRCYSKAASEHVVRTCGVHGKGFISLSEILVQLYCHGFKIGEVPSIFINRVRGESSVNSSEVRNALIGLFQIYRVKRSLEKNRM